MSDPSTGSGQGPSTGLGQRLSGGSGQRPSTGSRRLLERTLAKLRQRTTREDERTPAVQLSPAAFRAVVDERLRNLERQLDEVKARVHGLIFLLAGAVATQLVLRLLE